MDFVTGHVPLIERLVRGQYPDVVVTQSHANCIIFARGNFLTQLRSDGTKIVTLDYFGADDATTPNPTRFYIVSHQVIANSVVEWLNFGRHATRGDV